MTWPTAVILLPCLGILAATLFINHRFRFWLPVALAVASVVSGTVYLRTGIHETCLIAESECLGVTALAWIAAAVWGLFAIIFVARLAARKGKQ